MKKIQVTEQVADILRRSKIEGNRLTLPEQLARPDYVAVMKVIDAAGGKWNKGQKCHIFPDDPSETFSEALGSGQIADRSEKTIRTEKQAFYTPAAVADKLVEWACIEPGQWVLEPSAGLGALVVPAAKAGGIVTCIEQCADSAKAIGRIKLPGIDNPGIKEVFIGDFLTFKPGPRLREFDRVLMNPPFTKGQDVDHVTHAFKFLRTGGWLLAIMSKSFDGHSGKKYAAFRELLAANGEVLERLTDGEFKESGTSIDTVIVKLVK